MQSCGVQLIFTCSEQPDQPRHGGLWQLAELVTAQCQITQQGVSHGGGRGAAVHQPAHQEEQV